MCDILAAISYSHGYHERPRKRVKINMTIPSRPAPPPPQRNTTTPLRYTPTTDWDFCAFDSGPSSSGASNPVFAGNRANFPSQQPQYYQPNAIAKKPPPPRPPPPKLTVVPTAPLKKPGQPQSINILSSLFGHKRASTGAAANKSNGAAGASHQKSNPVAAGPIKLLPPPPTGSTKVLGKAPNHPGSFDHPSSSSSSNYGSLFSTATNTGLVATGTNADMQLISFDSPPSSPTFTQKSCSDCISVDSFSSDSNYSSPNNGNMSQAESGFEDDFVACANNNRQRAGSGVPWGDIDPFDAGSISGQAAVVPSPVIYGSIPMASSSSMTAQIRAPLVNSKLQQSDFIDPLCNGQSALPKVPTMSMPTIIKPPASSGSDSQKSTPSHAATALRSVGQKKLTETTNPVVSTLYAGNDYNAVVESDAFDSLTSHPMPSMPPPPPPSATDSYSEEPYGIALYDFHGEADEDLSFKTNEKIYLLKRLNEEWYMGRDKRGLEGMFPVNYVEVKVPLSDFPPEEVRQDEQLAASGDVTKVRALYHFNAETAEDLTIMENDLVTVLYQITPEWLYGQIDGRRGQFPANYIEYVPPNLPQMPTATS